MILPIIGKILAIAIMVLACVGWFLMIEDLFQRRRDRAMVRSARDNYERLRKKRRLAWNDKIEVTFSEPDLIEELAQTLTEEGQEIIRREDS